MRAIRKRRIDARNQERRINMRNQERRIDSDGELETARIDKIVELIDAAC